MAVAVVADAAYPQAVVDEFNRLAKACYPCFQCGACTSSCPSGRELYRGPRRLVRLILAGEIEAVLKSDDLWRCTGCGACTDVCRMDIDVAAVLGGLRRLERAHGTTIRCPERSAADIATSRLRKQPRIDNMQLGVAMMARGHFPKDKVGAAESGMKIAKQMLPLRGRRPAGEAGPAAAGTTMMPFYAGCAILQDDQMHALVYEVATGFGVRLDSATDGGCCGHPSRGAVPSRCDSEDAVQTACPACDSSLKEAGIASVPLWTTLTERARRSESGLEAAAPRFVPYVGCLADRDASLAVLADAAEQAGVTMEMAYPTLHNGCCGALGGMYRGATKASAMLLEFAVERRAPVVTPCILCRDNLRSAARELRLDATVHFWPEFFRAAATAPEVPTDD